MERETRVARACRSCLQGLRLAHGEAKGASDDPARWGWVSVGMASALQAALVAALSGYETSQLEDVVDPSNADRYAPIALLLRRAKSAEYLNLPERLELPGSMSRRIERVLLLRNQTLHALGGEAGDRIEDDVATCLQVVAKLMTETPSFEPTPHAITLAGLRDEISGLRRHLSAIG